MFQQLESWLHQHIFKVGWLVTKNFQTTTILYYTFFLPGVVLYELIYWLTAGFLDVHADQSFALPEKQEMGELKLNFVKLTKKASKWKVAVITIAPVVIGLIVVWFIANNILDIDDKLSLLQPANLENFRAFVDSLTGSTDFWLWSYVMFTVINTLTPDFDAVRPWMWGMTIGASLLGFLLLLGADEVTGTGSVFETITNGFNALSGVIALMLVFDLVAVGILGLLESTIEWITGDSATFKNGKMITMTRQEAIEQRQKDRRTRRAQQAKKQALPEMAGAPSIYKLELPIPGPPGKEPVLQKPSAVLLSASDESKDTDDIKISAPASSSRIRPNVISGTPSESDTDDASSRSAIRFNLPSKIDDSDDEDDDIADEDIEDGDIDEDETLDDEITYEDVEDSA